MWANNAKAPPLITPTKREIIGGLIYLPVHMFLLGLILAVLWIALGLDLSHLTQNIIYFTISTVVLITLCFDYLRRSFHAFLAFGWRNLPVCLQGYGIRFVLGIPVAVAIAAYAPSLQNPNQDAVVTLIAYDVIRTGLLAVILAPIVEEILFRGIVFAALCPKSRALAYLVSTLLFGFLHVAAFLILNFSPGLFLTMAIYFPAGIALAWAYEKSGTVITPIVLHALMNGVAIALSSVGGVL